MFVAHFATALAIRGRTRQLPVGVYIGGAFLLDGLWIGLAVIGIDQTPWSDWSHSLIAALVWAGIAAFAVARLGAIAAGAMWVAVFSHWPLDVLIQGSSLYPGASPDLLIPVLIAGKAGWWTQRLLSAALLLVFLDGVRRSGASMWRAVAACVLIGLLSLR